MRHAHTLGSKSPIFFKLFDTLLNEMSGSYPELKRGKDLIVETLKNEEEKFSSLLDRGIKILDENLEKVKNKISDQYVNILSIVRGDAVNNQYQ